MSFSNFPGPLHLLRPHRCRRRHPRGRGRDGGAWPRRHLPPGAGASRPHPLPPAAAGPPDGHPGESGRRRRRARRLRDAAAAAARRLVHPDLCLRRGCPGHPEPGRRVNAVPDNRSDGAGAYLRRSWAKVRKQNWIHPFSPNPSLLFPFSKGIFSCSNAHYLSSLSSLPFFPRFLQTAIPSAQMRVVRQF